MMFGLTESSPAWLGGDFTILHTIPAGEAWNPLEGNFAKLYGPTLIFFLVQLFGILEPFRSSDSEGRSGVEGHQRKTFCNRKAFPRNCKKKKMSR